LIMRKAVAISVIFLLSAGLASADLSDFYGKTISSIKLSETAAADSFLVFNTSGLTPGQILTAGEIQDAVKKIYALGIFSDVEIYGQQSDKGVDLLIQLEAYPRIAKIKFRGNDKIKTKKLQKEITLNEGRIISPGAVKSNIRIIKNLYEDKGYLKATVASNIEPDKDDPEKAVLTFNIVEGAKVKVRRIAFVGNRAFTDDKLRSKISTKQKSLFRGGSFDREKFKEDKKKIIDFYKKEGYIDAVVTADTILYGDTKTMKYAEFSDTAYAGVPDLYIKIYVDEGERYYFGDFSWDGNEILSDERLGSIFDVEAGDVYNQEKYDKMLFKLYEMYQDEGYWYVQIDEQKTPRDQQLDVHYAITENNPVHVRLIHIEGNTKTKDKVIRRELKIKPNTIFKRSVLGRSLREVMVLNFFANVNPDWNILDNGDIDLIIKVEEKPTGQFQLGAGYSAVDKLVGTVGLGMPNFMGGGQTVSFNSDFGKNRTTFSLSYFEPWLFDTPTSVGVSVYYQERDWYDWFTEGNRGGSIRVGRRLRWPDNYFRLYASYSLEELKYFSISQSYKDEQVDNPYSVDKITWPRRTSTVSLTLERDSRDLAQFATKGADAYWTGELGGTFLGGSWDYYKHTVGTEYYITPLWKFTFALKGKWGFMDGIYHGDADVPYSERFTPGGTDPDGILRGYEDSRVGPVTSSGGYIGGRSMAVYNLEMIIPLAEQQFYGVLFADAGNAWRTGDDLIDNFYRYKGLYKSVGFGFRVVAPMIAIIGFDFGIPFNGPKADQGKLRPHFQIGSGF
jgi:outer membrane protein insertion porin family